MMARFAKFGRLGPALLAATATLAIGPTMAVAQAPAAATAAPQDLTKIPPLNNFQPKKTSWGDPDLRGMWPIDSLGGLPMQRTPAQGNRVFLTDEEYKAREAAMERSREAADKETKSNKLGMGNWVEMTGAGRRTSLLIDPPDGRLPALTEEGIRQAATQRSSWVPAQTYDWVDDFDSWDRCVTRGFPASMLPFRYNNGVQIFQAPGYVVINLEMIHDARIIPLDGRGKVDGITSWFGQSRGHWEGNTLVIETSHIRPGASPLNMATIGLPPDNTMTMSPQAHVTERLTLNDANTLVYEMTYNDPVIFTKPFTVRMDIPRNSEYQFFEYACHEGDVQIRNYIVASRAERAKVNAAYDEARKAELAAATPVEPAKTTAKKK